MRACLVAALAAFAAAASEVTLGDMALTLRRELHLGEMTPIPDVVDESCRALGLATEGLSLRERAQRAYDEVRPSAAAAPAAAHRRLIDANELDNTTALKRQLLGLDDREIERTSVYDYTTVPSDCVVRLQLAIIKLMDVDSAGQTVFLSGYLRHYWVDPRLAWDPADWGGVTDVTFKKGTTEVHGIWTPDVVMIEAFESWDKTPDPDFTVYSSGDVFFSRAATFKFPCAMKVDLFPFDNQECTFTFGSWSFHGFVLDVQPRLSGGEYSAIALDMYQKNFEFVLTDVHTRHYNFYYSCCPEPYPTLEVTFKLQRESLTFVNGIIIPMIVSTVAGFLAYFTNPAAGERIGLGITVLLVLGVLYLVATEEMPKGGDRTTLSDIYIVSTIYTIFTLFISALGVSLANIKESNGPMSEGKLLAIFTESDEDNSGDLDLEELADAIRRAGLTKAQVRKVQKAVNEKGKDRLDFCDWYDIIAPISHSDGLAAYHSCFVWALVELFLRYERQQRRHLIQRQSSTIGVERRESTHGGVQTNIIADHPETPRSLVPEAPRLLRAGSSWLIDMVGAPKQDEQREQAPPADETKTATAEDFQRTHGLPVPNKSDARAPSVPPDTSDNGDAPDACLPSPPRPTPPPADGMGYLELDSVCCGSAPLPNKSKGYDQSGPADFKLAVFDEEMATPDQKAHSEEKCEDITDESCFDDAHPDGVPRQRRPSSTASDDGKEEFWRGGWSTVNLDEVRDASETLGRRICGKMDALMSVVVPMSYFMIVAIMLGGGYISAGENTGAAVHTESVL